MKLLISLLFAAVIFAGCSTTDSREMLFNGKDLSGWTVFVGDTSVAPENFFYVKEGVIETPGVPMGYLRTTGTFSDYKLHVEWRYTKEPTNSGIFLHTNGPDKLWPAHFQCQLKQNDAGDFIVHGTGQRAMVRDSLYVSSETIKPVVPKLTASSEVPPGEWNNADIVCSGDSIRITINGVLQNEASKVSLTSGGIGLQAEGSTIQFRNIWIERIKK